MFRCLNRQAHDIVILDDRWDSPTELKALRALGREDALLCPECRQPVLVKAGVRKIRHLAHRELGDCALQNESSELLQARRALYAWLQQRLGDGARGTVTVEKRVHPDLPRPVDCWVELAQGGCHAYWILDHGVRNRQELHERLAGSGAWVHWLFTADTLRRVPNGPAEYDLSTTERQFILPSDYARPYGLNTGCLHYLNGAEEGRLITLRGLWLSHAPQRFGCAAELTTPLAEVRMTPQGDWVHPGEHEALTEFREQERRKREAEAERKRKEAEAARKAEELRLEAEKRRRDIKERRREAERQVRERQTCRDAEARPPPTAPTPWMERPSSAQAVREDSPLPPSPEPPVPSLPRWGSPLPCECCGQTVSRYLSMKPDAGTCVCIPCGEKRQRERIAATPIRPPYTGRR